MKAFGSDDQIKNGDKEQQIVCELELMEPNNVQVEQTKLTENDFVTRLKVQIMISQERKNRASSAKRRLILQRGRKTGSHPSSRRYAH